MARDFKLPDLGEGLTEAEIVKVLIAEGDQVQEDQPVFLVETEKAQVELPSPFGGQVAKVHVRAGERVKVGSVLVSFVESGRSPVAASAGREASARAARASASDGTATGGGKLGTTRARVPSSRIGYTSRMPWLTPTRRSARFIAC